MSSTRTGAERTVTAAAKGAAMREILRDREGGRAAAPRYCGVVGMACGHRTNHLGSPILSRRYPL
jgi:hypothetical protein